MATALFATGIAAVLALKITKHFALFIQRVNYKMLMSGVVVFLVVMTAVLTGVFGLLILATATGIGLLPPLWGVKRTHAMGVLMLPIILWGLGFGFK